MFTAKIKPKRPQYFDRGKFPFPIIHQNNGSLVRITGIFTGFSVTVTNKDHMKILLESGCYGKCPKSTTGPVAAKRINSDDSAELLILDLEESFFLFYVLEILDIVDLNGTEISIQTFLNKIIQIKSNFLQTFVGYMYLKSKNWVVKSGIKFGGDFLIYKDSVKCYHASFVVLISNGESRRPQEIQGIQRTSETSNKDVLFLEVLIPNDIQIMQPIKQLENLNKFKISELIIRRFDYKQFSKNAQ